MIIPAEIRIYFECFEQANHYVLPVVEEKAKLVFGKKIPVKLVKLRKFKDNHKYDRFYSKRIANLLFWKDPDILVSFVYDHIEIPVFIVEFSTAVFTEDHELQRFDGLAASAENDIVFIKISPISKTSEYDHGGNIKFDYKIPFALIFRRYGILPFHIEWKSKGSIVEVNDNYLSCPKAVDDFREVVEIIFKSVDKFRLNKKKLVELAKSSEKFSKWVEQLESMNINLFEDRKDETTRIIIKNNYAEIKINRFGHAMDPERGMLVFYSVYFNGNIISKMVFNDDPEKDAWYKQIPKEEEIREYISKKGGLKKPLDFLYIFYLGTNLDKIIPFEDFQAYIDIQKNDYIILNISEFIERYWHNLSKPLRTIFKYSKEFHIEDKNGVKRVIFKWDKNILRKVYLNNTNNNKQSINITPIRKLSEIDEDLVTYIVIHHILRPQGYKILAASYPGAQGDRVILVEKVTKGGRRQERKYIDIISFSKSRNITTLQNNKGKFSVTQINKDIDELVKYKKEKSYKEGLKLFFERFEKDAINSIIKIGVGFWSHKKYNAESLKKIKLDELDYFVLITSDMKKWKVWRCGDIDLLDKYEGEVCIPIIFEPTENITLDQFIN